MSYSMPIRASVGLALLALAGCAQVKPHADYVRTADLIRQRVPTTQVFEPQQPAVALPDMTDSLTLQEALQTALLQNRELQMAFRDIGVAQADLVQSQLLKNPVFSLAGLMPEGGGRARLDVSFSQEIADLWQIPVRKKIAQAALDEAMFKVVRQAVDVTAMVKENYHRLQVLKESERIANENIEIAQRNEELTQARLSAGQAGKVDADLAHAAVLQAQLALIDLERQRRVARADLALAMGLQHWPATDVALDPLPAPQTQPIDVDACVQQALAERADLQAAKRAIDAAQTRIREQWLMVFPSVMMGFFLERMEARSGSDISTSDTEGMAGEAAAGKLGIRPRTAMAKEGMIDAVLGPMISAPLPIFDQNQAQIAKIVIMYQQEVSRYEQLSQQIERDVRAAAADYMAGTNTLVFYQNRLLPQLRQNLESATSAYQAGNSTVFVIIEAQRSLTMTNTDLYMARMTQLMAADQLERAMGGPLVRQRADEAAPTSQPPAATSQP